MKASSQEYPNCVGLATSPINASNPPAPISQPGNERQRSRLSGFAAVICLWALIS
jgi:hypothetical protein